MAVSECSRARRVSSSGLLSPKIIESAKRNITIPPATWKADSGMSMAVRRNSPPTTKASSTTAETSVAINATRRFPAAS